MITWKEARDKSKIKRIPYKRIFGKTLTQFILDNKYRTNADLLEMILKRIKLNKQEVAGWNWIKITENVKISISARRAEQTIYKK